MARLALCRAIYYWGKSVLTLYLAEGGVGIITGGNAAWEHGISVYLEYDLSSPIYLRSGDKLYCCFYQTVAVKTIELCRKQEKI